MDISDGPLLEQVNESGEIHFGTITDKTHRKAIKAEQLMRRASPSVSRR